MAKWSSLPDEVESARTITMKFLRDSNIVKPNNIQTGSLIWTSANGNKNTISYSVRTEEDEAVLVKDTKHNQPIIKAANSGLYADNANTKTVHVFAHGNPKEFYNENGKKGETTINSGAGLNNVLNQSSELWKNSESKEGFTVVLHSCRTGRTTIDKNGNVKESIAETLSKSKEMKGVTIIAPDERDYFSSDGTEIGPRETTNTDNNGVPLPGKSHDDLKRTETEGNWNVFKNGERTGQYDGSWVPKANPNFIDNLLHKN